MLGALLDAFEDREALNPQQEALVRAHLKECETCQQRKRQIAAIALLLRGIPRITPRRTPRPPRSQRRYPGRVLLVALIGAALAGFGWWRLGGPTLEELSDGGRGGGAGDEPTATFEFVNAPPLTEEATTCPDCPVSPASVFCGSACQSDADCAGLGINPACAGGNCWDAQTCGAATDGSTSGGDPGGGSGGPPDPCDDAVCGDGFCDPLCGEDVVTCPADC